MSISNTPTKTLPEHRARPADDFVHSIGLATHYNFLDTVYAARYEDIGKPVLAELGVKHIRDGIDPNSSSRTYDMYRDLYQTLGVRVTGVVQEHKFDDVPPGPAFFDSVVSASGGAIEAFEGPNEYNNRHADGWGEGLRAFQCGLFRNLNASSNPRIPLLAPAIGKDAGEYPPYSEVPNLADCSDLNNVHAYPGANMPTGWHGYGGYDSRWFDYDVPMSNHVGAAGRPIMMTETGYTTPDPGGYLHAVSAEAKKRYTPRLTFECFNAAEREDEPDANFARCYFYQLIDHNFSDTNYQYNWGLVANDGTRTPAFRALENTIDIVQDPGPAHEAGALRYAIMGADSDVHSTLLQDRDGAFYLALWQEVESYDMAIDVDRTPSVQNVVIDFRIPKSRVDVYDIAALGRLPVTNDAEKHPARTLSAASEVSVAVEAEVKIVKVTP